MFNVYFIKLSYTSKKLKMSDILLDYLNNNVQLSKKIQNIETEFKNGVYFCELIEKVFNLKPLNYISNPKNYYEILQNFDIIKNKNIK